jgi:folate-binding protein YgfZ
LQHDGGKKLLLDTEIGLAEKACQHLGRFRISEDVEFTDRTAAFALIHICGPMAVTLTGLAVKQAVESLAPWQHLELQTGVVVRRHDLLNHPGFDLFAPADQAALLWKTLVDAGAVPAGAQAFEILRIEAGVPAWGAELDEDRLVMETGRIQQAISFNKGCYLGQESIVMARDRGHVNRQLMGLRLPAGCTVLPGAKVQYNGQEAGQVTSCVQSARLGTTIALAYLRRGCQTPGTVIEIETGQERQQGVISELPFAATK